VRTAVLASMALLLLGSFPVAAADIGGKWAAQVPGPNHLLLEPTFTFNVDGAKLTGAMTFPLGDQIYRLEITEGKVSGDDVSFVVIGKLGNSEIKWIFNGKVAGNKIEFTLELQGGPGGAAPGEFDVTAKRVGS
jgi:hypothetical protein